MIIKVLNTTSFMTMAGLLLIIGIASIFMIPTTQQQALAQVKQPQNTPPMTGSMAMGNMTSTPQMQMMSGMMDMMSGMMNMMSPMPMTTMSGNAGMNTMSSMHAQGANMTTMR